MSAFDPERSSLQIVSLTPPADMRTRITCATRDCFAVTSVGETRPSRLPVTGFSLMVGAPFAGECGWDSVSSLEAVPGDTR